MHSLTISRAAVAAGCGCSVARRAAVAAATKRAPAGMTIPANPSADASSPVLLRSTLGVMRAVPRSHDSRWRSRDPLRICHRAASSTQTFVVRASDCIRRWFIAVNEASAPPGRPSRTPAPRTSHGRVHVGANTRRWCVALRRSNTQKPSTSRMRSVSSTCSPSSNRAKLGAAAAGVVQTTAKSRATGGGMVSSASRNSSGGAITEFERPTHAREAQFVGEFLEIEIGQQVTAQRRRCALRVGSSGRSPARRGCAGASCGRPRHAAEFRQQAGGDAACHDVRRDVGFDDAASDDDGAVADLHARPQRDPTRKAIRPARS